MVYDNSCTTFLGTLMGTLLLCIMYGAFILCIFTCRWVHCILVLCCALYYVVIVHPMDNVTIIVINLVLILTGFFFNFNHENYVAHPATTDIISLRGMSCRAYIIYIHSNSGREAA